MRSPGIHHNDLQFLSGGGEMGGLTRAKDWSKTPVGDPHTWPQSLRTTLSILLNSRFPMFLWWGPELTCFYNDAYRPSLGINGKHPSILGEPAEQAWAEIWPIIKPLIDQVLSGGEATWSEDQLIPIYRNGKLEDVYWTFSYSPVNDESGKVSGVLVTCSETTEKIRVFTEIKEREAQLSFTINAAELGTWDLDPSTNKFTGNDRLKEWFGLTPDAEILLELAINNIIEKDRQRVIEAIQAALRPGPGGNYDIEYTIRNPVTSQERRVLAKGKAVFDSNGIAYRFSGILQDITQQVITFQATEENEQRFRNVAEKLNIVVEASELGTWEWNIQTDEIIYSKRHLEIFGYDEGCSIDHKKQLAHIHPDDAAIRDIAVAKAMKKGHLNYEIRIVWKDGSIHWIEAKGKVFYDDAKQPEKLIGTIRDITEDKMREQELLENEQRFRLLADSMPQHIWTADPEGNLNYYNQSVFSYTGLTLEQIDADGWLQIVHPDDREENTRQWMEAVGSGKDFLFEHRFRRHDGEYRWQLSRAIPQKDANGNIQMWVGTSTDIQDQKTFAYELERQVKERTKELNESEERYHLMVEEVQDYAILYLNHEGIVENWNKGAEKIKGYKAEEIIGKSFRTFYTGQDRKINLPERLLEMARTQGKALQEGFRVRKDGSLFWASVVITAVHNEQGDVIGFSKVTHDLTEKKAAQDALKKSEERYHLMVEEVQDYAIIYLNREGFIENWNKGAEKIKGYKAEEIIGKNFSVFYTELDRQDNLPKKLLNEAAVSGKALQEGWRVRKNGSLFWASVVITAVHDEQKNVIGFSKVTHDLTDKKIAEDTLKKNAEQLAQKNAELEKMNIELQSFAYVSSHDLQEPLRKIQTFASRIIAKEADQLSETGKDYFSRMQEAAARMQTLIQDLLAYSRTSTAERLYEETDLNEIVKDVKNDLKEMLAEKNAVVETGKICKAPVIPFQFRQLLSNLITNAVKFSKPGEPPHVIISCERVKGDETKIMTLSPEKTYCHISVSDNGIGFDPQYRDRIFVVFQRLHGKEQYQGTGIGLAIVKKIVENHNGAITATGELNKGARFDIFIPA